jgi:hypothetical protein
VITTGALRGGSRSTIEADPAHNRQRQSTVASVKRVAMAAAAAILALAGCDLAAGTTTFGQPLPHPPRSWPIVILQVDAPWWPVQQAMANWRIPVFYGTCNPAVNCIHVTEVPALPNTASGLQEAGSTVMTMTAGRPTSVQVQLADNAPNLPGRRLETACHELGHAFGLGHDNTGGCMRAGVDGLHTVPSFQELARLKQLYGIAG